MLDDDDIPPPRPPGDTPLGRILGRNAAIYAEAWGVDLDNEDGRKLFDLESKFMSVAHSEHEEEARRRGQPALDFEAFALQWRPATLAETLRTLAEDIRREREGRSLRKLGPGFKTIPGGRS
jgi:hypothetical protein